MTISKDIFALEGKVAIITGAGGRPGGIGEAYASGLAAFGASVVVADINADGAQAAAERLRQKGGKALGVHVDISDKASVDAMVAEAAQAFGSVDILVNNAALMIEQEARTATSVIDLSVWNRLLAINLTGALLCSQAVAPLMRERGWGRIINQSSAGAYPAQSAYGITKLAMVGLTTTLATELGRSGITVNAIAPGITDSGAGLSQRDNPSRWSQMMVETAPLRAIGVPDELAGALVLLCSQAGNWITGQVINIDGGIIMRP